MSRCGPGDFFGEISLLDGGARTPRPSSPKSRAVVVDREDCDRVMRCGRAQRWSCSRPAAGACVKRTRSCGAPRRARERRDRGTSAPSDENAMDFGVQRQPGFLFIHIGMFFCGSCSIRGRSAVCRSAASTLSLRPAHDVRSLEAIILSVFVLLTRPQVARDRVRNDVEYDINLKASSRSRTCTKNSTICTPSFCNG